MSRFSKIQFGLLSFLALGISLYSLSYIIFGARYAPPGIAANFNAKPFFFLLHVGGGIIALSLGIWQFLARTRKSRWHRYAGRTYVIACISGGIGGLAIAVSSSAGPIAQGGFSVLAVLWIATTVKAYTTARNKDFKAHRIWMWRSFGLTCAAITLRLYLPIGGMLGVDFLVLYQFTSWACWITSLTIAELTRRFLDRRVQPVNSVPTRV